MRSMQRRHIGELLASYEALVARMNDGTYRSEREVLELLGQFELAAQLLHEATTELYAAQTTPYVVRVWRMWRGVA